MNPDDVSQPKKSRLAPFVTAAALALVALLGARAFFRVELFAKAVEHGQVKAAQTLLKLSPDVLEKARAKNEPLLVAVKNGDAAMLAMLLERGDHELIHLQATIGTAIKAGRSDLALMTLEKASDSTPWLLTAAHQGDWVVAKRALELGPSLQGNQKLGLGLQGRRILDDIISQDAPIEIIELALKKGVNPGYGLVLAFDKGRVECVKLLLDNGVSVEGNSGLMLYNYIKNNHKKQSDVNFVRFALEEVVDGHDFTFFMPGHLRASNFTKISDINQLSSEDLYHLEIINMLLENGASMKKAALKTEQNVLSLLAQREARIAAEQAEAPPAP